MGNQVKHILIILSFLLLSSPVIGNSHKGETLYGWGKFPFYTWKGFGDKDTNPIYKGNVENGEPNGQGTLIFPDGERYVGEWNSGSFNGQGTYTFSNGGKYEGEFKYGERNGQGKSTFPNGEKYEGEHKDGEFNGQGTYTYIDGRKYLGEWKDGKMWNGIYYDKDGNIVGKYVNGEWRPQ